MTMTREPICATPAWRAAVEAAGEQCQGRVRGARCGHTLAGGYRLYLGADGRVYCPDHHAPQQPAAAAAGEVEQGSLF